MSNLIDIQSQIEKLQKQANDIKAREFDRTVQEILAKMQAFGISYKDLQSAGVRGARPRVGVRKGDKGVRVKPAKAAAAIVAAKFRGPNGETWSGRGLMPRWLTSEISKGGKKEDFAIQV